MMEMVHLNHHSDSKSPPPLSMVAGLWWNNNSLSRTLEKKEEALRHTRKQMIRNHSRQAKSQAPNSSNCVTGIRILLKTFCAPKNAEYCMLQKFQAFIAFCSCVKFSVGRWAELMLLYNLLIEREDRSILLKKTPVRKKGFN